MKSRFSLISTLSLALLLLGGCSGTEQVTFFTEGNCPECEALIVAALEAAEGIQEVSWNMETSLTTVAYSPHKTDPERIQEIVAEAGFVTQLFPPNEEKRAALPECCRQQIDRKLRQKEVHE